MKKKLFAVMSAAALAASFAAGCGSSGNSSSNASSYTEKVKANVSAEDSISAIPAGKPNTIDWFSYYDLNPTKAQPEKSTNLALFEKKGGKIHYVQTSSMKKYDDLAARLLANNPPDMFAYEEGMTFPANCVKGMFQPVDDVVDLNSDMWKDVKSTADQFVLGGKHYVVPVTFGALSMITYDKEIMQAAGLEDPYNLYKQGKWDWNTWYNMMKDYCNGATGDEERYGINGWFGPFIFQSTGKTLVKYNQTKDQFESDLYNADLERAANLLYNIKKNGFYCADWIGSATEAFKKKVLFYAMGTWAVSPKKGDNWGIVPMPKDPNTDTLYNTVAVNAYMWVKGSDKKDAYKCWLECSKTVASDTKYAQTNMDKFYVNQPYWTKEMYDIAFNEVESTKFTKLIDPGYGISTKLSDNDAATNDTLEAVIPYMYTSVMKEDEGGTQLTWTKLREAYKNTINSEIKTFNDAYHKFEKTQDK